VAHVRIKQGERTRCPAELRQHLDQVAAPQVVLHREAIGLEQPRAMARQAQPAQHIARATGAARGRHIDLAATLHEDPRNVASRTGQLELDAVVLPQVFQRLWRARAPQVAGRGHQHQLGVFELARDQVRIRRQAPANRQVVAFFGKVDIAVADMHVHVHLRIALAEFPQQRQHAMMGIGRGQADAQLAGRFGLLAGDFTFGFGQ